MWAESVAPLRHSRGGLTEERPAFEPESSSPASHGLERSVCEKERVCDRRYKHGGEVDAQLPLRTQKMRA
ncbi:hypothetical protein Q8A67_025483 [Cirrhinus molitorella]|uniref:Uncharacterized protein n=1 Tax=Cirrhinus molitorella TaxID=172907 RepID=A0AA88NZP5_9TELE|nr:hypothetical protein Q8A67_025483 [Cirrhinus molitorella]